MNPVTESTKKSYEEVKKEMQQILIKMGIDYIKKNRET